MDDFQTAPRSARDGRLVQESDPGYALTGLGNDRLPSFSSESSFYIELM